MSKPPSTQRAANCRPICRAIPLTKKLIPADSPILMIALTSDLIPRAAMYDIASSILQQKILQVKGVGDVNIGGGALPAVRVGRQSDGAKPL
jgi:multidrug efflux pump